MQTKNVDNAACWIYILFQAKGASQIFILVWSAKDDVQAHTSQVRTPSTVGVQGPPEPQSAEEASRCYTDALHIEN